MPVLSAASRASTALVDDEVEAAAATMRERPAVAAALYAIVGVLGGNPGLRRTLAESSVETADRGALVRRLFEGKVPKAALDLTVAVVDHRWSTPWDLVDAIEGAGNQLLLITAEKARHLDAVEDQLFRFGRIIGGDGALRSALNDRAQPGDRRAALATSLLADRADPVTVALVAQGVLSSGHPSAELAIDDLLELTAVRRERSIATVTSAIALTDQQLERLVSALTASYGRPISVRVDVDPTIRGGLIVRVADELIDGSVVSRLAAARGAFGS